MPKKGKKNPADMNVTAFQILQAATATGQPDEKPAKTNQPKKNPAAVALGRLGGLKGGKARAAKLSQKRRVEIAQKAAQSRWKQS